MAGIPLVNSNGVDDINTSIIAIKKEINSVGNTEVNVTLNMPENSIPIDAVTDGDMHAVTSNAVSRAMSYSTEEVNTGKKWIDGKAIYKKVFSIDHPANSTADINFTVSDNLDNITKVEYVTSKITHQGDVWQFFHQGIWGTDFDWAIAYLRLNNGLAMTYRSAYAPYAFVLQVTVEYTKTN